MKKKNPKKPVRSILHLSELVEITDPAEQAEMDRRFRAAERAIDVRETAPKKRRARKGEATKSKSRKTPYKPVLQNCELVPVTDPAEFAELERRVRKAEKAMAVRESVPRKRPARKAK